MRQNVVVSDRGQITLPAGVRKRLGIEAGSVVVLEERGGEVVLKPAAVVALETYPEADIARWDEEDALSDAERARIGKRVRKRA
jgi:AbrB family looped-hinge helix DNA binding protein